MRVLVAEYTHSGHHFEHLQYLLPALFDAGVRVTLGISDAGYHSKQYQQYLEPFSHNFDVLSLGDTCASKSWSHTRQRVASISDVIRTAGADHVLLPSADSATLGYMFADRSKRVALRSALRSGVNCSVCIHGGPRGMKDNSLGQLAKGAYAPFAFAVSPWQRINFLNPLVYEHVSKWYSNLRGRVGTIPSPVPNGLDLDRIESRRGLGIPEDGRYIVLAGGLSTDWKGVDRLLDVFVRGKPDKNSRLLLAGSLGARNRRLMNDLYPEQISSGQIISIDRFLTDEEFSWAISSADLVAVAYPRFQRVSGILVRAVAAGRPVITDDSGWLGYVTRNFQLGWTCDVKNPGQFAERLSLCLEASEGYEQTAKAKLFKEYHKLENFQLHWMRELGILANQNLKSTPLTWEQILTKL